MSAGSVERAMRGWGKIIVSLLAAVQLAGCARDKPLDIACPRFEEFRIAIDTGPEVARIAPADEQDHAVAADISGRRGADPLAAALAPALDKLRPRVDMDIDSLRTSAADGPAALILSGGGQWGAFGAGFMSGWSEKGAGPTARPARMDIVTGISTGSLQSTFAFLGTQEDEAMRNAYMISSERQLLKRHGDMFFIRHGSMADTAPLEAHVRKAIAPLIPRVAADENQGRALLVGVVDALDGRFYAVDLTRMARTLKGQERDDCYIAALMASSAVPVVFRQMTVSGRPYMDGGVRQSVFVTAVQQALSRAAAVTARDGRRREERAPPVRTFVLVNGDITPSRVETLPAKLLPTVNRLRSIVFNQVELSSIVAVAHASSDQRVYLATAKGHQCRAPDDSDEEVFNPPQMACLCRYGRALWQGGQAWAQYDATQGRLIGAPAARPTADVANSDRTACESGAGNAAPTP